MITAEKMRNIAIKNGKKLHENRAYKYFDRDIRTAARKGYYSIPFNFTGGYIDETGNWVGADITRITLEEARQHYKELGFTFRLVTKRRRGRPRKDAIGAMIPDFQEEIAW